MMADRWVHYRRGNLVVRHGLNCGFAVLWVGVNRGRGRPGSLAFWKGVQNLGGTDLGTSRLAQTQKMMLDDARGGGGALIRFQMWALMRRRR